VDSVLNVGFPFLFSPSFATSLELPSVARIHILNASSGQCLPLVEECRRQGGNLSLDTCPHYLALAAEEVPECGTEFKTWPPIRERRNQEHLWPALRLGGAIRMIGSDHSPATPGARALTCGRGRGNFLNAWPGINSVQLSLPVVWTAANQRGKPGSTPSLTLIAGQWIANIKYTQRVLQLLGAYICIKSEAARAPTHFWEPTQASTMLHTSVCPVFQGALFYFK